MAKVTNTNLNLAGDVPMLHLRFAQLDPLGNLWMIEAIGLADSVHEFANLRPLEVFAEPLKEDPRTIIRKEWKPLLAASDAIATRVSAMNPTPLPIVIDDNKQPVVQQPMLHVRSQLVNLVIPTPIRISYLHDPTLTETNPYTKDDVVLPEGKKFVKADLLSPATAGTLKLKLSGASVHTFDWQAKVSAAGSNPSATIENIIGGYWTVEAFRDTGNPTFSIRGDFIIP